MWSVVRQLLGCGWSLTSFAQFYAILTSFAGRPRRLLWFLFVAQSWALWLIRNKITLESKLIRQPADFNFKTIIFLQLWSPSVKPQDRASIQELVNQLRRTHAEVLASDAEERSWWRAWGVQAILKRPSAAPFSCLFIFNFG
jgi:hypothetical protein